MGNVVKTGMLNIQQGDVFDFEILDLGSDGLFFTMTEVGDPSNTALVTADLLSDTFDQNYVVFHNREGGHVSYLDNVSIAFIPEPTTLLIWSLLAILGLTLGWRRRKR